jgi:FkbM family methyltransferase
MIKNAINILLSYRIKMFIRDLILWVGNPFQIISFSAQHKRICELAPFETIVHVGADTGQESVFYEFLKTKRVVWVEANPDTFKILLKRIRARKHSVQVAVNALISSRDDAQLELNLFSLSGANSVYAPTKDFLDLNHKRFLTGKKLVLETSTLPRVLESLNYNLEIDGSKLLVIDVEGHELEVLKGCTPNFLSKFDYIMCEVSKFERHIGAASFEEITSFLNKNEFIIDFEGPREIFDDVIYKNSRKR